MHILILEDDPAQQELYKLWFNATEHTCECHSTAAIFVESLKRNTSVLLLLDLMLQESSGQEVLQWVRKNIGWDIPIIIVTAIDSEASVVAALRAGADDYIVKPPKFMELLARIESLTRRGKAPAVINLGHYEIIQEDRCILADGKPVDLTQKEYELSSYIFSKPGKLLSRVHLLEKIWGLHADIDTRTVDTHMSRIRRKLDIKPAHGWQIIPVYGYGYRIEKISSAS